MVARCQTNSPSTRLALLAFMLPLAQTPEPVTSKFVYCSNPVTEPPCVQTSTAVGARAVRSCGALFEVTAEGAVGSTACVVAVVVVWVVVWVVPGLVAGVV